MDKKSCRLCSASATNSHLNIFSEHGTRMEMADILTEHFKCHVSQSDPLPNVVCQVCWATTKSFHELYKKSKEVEGKLLASLVKSEPGSTDVELPTSNVECITIIEEIDPIKLEQNTDKLIGSPVELNNDHPIEDANDSDADDFDDDDHNDGYDRHADVDDTEYKTKEPKKKCKPSQAKKKNEEYQKAFNENRHLFDMSCDFCSRTFESLSEAQKHYSKEHNITSGYIKSTSGNKLFYRCNIMQYVDRHLNPDKFKCTECNQTFVSQRCLTKHIERHRQIKKKPKEKLYQCDMCKRAFVTETSLESHKKVHMTESSDNALYDQFIADNFDMSCDQCDAKFTAFYDARQHYKNKHNEDDGYIKCCGKKLKKLSCIREHINTHLSSETINCDVCQKSFKTRMQMIKHRFVHKTFICDYCKKKFNNKRSLRNHFFTNHVSSEPKFECELCHKKFQLKNLLKTHKYAVHREKKASVTCWICGKSFHFQFFLDKHMLTHTDKSERLAMRTQCEHCGEWLMSKSGIFYHKQLHTSGVQKCDQCDMELPNKPALMGHIRQYHRAHKFKCSYCHKTFPIDSKLRKHEEYHTRHKTYECKFCPKVFSVASSLQTHTRRNHKEEQEMSKQIKNLAQNFPFKT